MVTFIYNILFGLVFWEFKSLPKEKNRVNPITKVYRRAYEAKKMNMVRYNRTKNK